MGVRFLLAVALVLAGLWLLRTWLLWDRRRALGGSSAEARPSASRPAVSAPRSGPAGSSAASPAADDPPERTVPRSAGRESGEPSGPAPHGSGADAGEAPATGRALRERGERVLDDDRLSGLRARIARLEGRLAAVEAAPDAIAAERGTARAEAAETAAGLRRLRDELTALGRAPEPDLERLEGLERAVDARFEECFPEPRLPSGERLPAALFERPDERDDLKRIKGIGPVMEGVLNALGVTTFRQLASFSPEDVERVSEAIGTFPGRIERDDWVGRARQLLERAERSA